MSFDQHRLRHDEQKNQPRQPSSRGDPSQRKPPRQMEAAELDIVSLLHVAQRRSANVDLEDSKIH